MAAQAAPRDRRRDSLAGVVEADETHLGGRREGEVDRRKTLGSKDLLVVAAEERGGGPRPPLPRARSHRQGRVPRRRPVSRVHGVASLLKRWLLGTPQGAVSSKHLAGYLAEFEFWFNRRCAKLRSRLFESLVGLALRASATPFWKVVQAPRQPQYVGGA